LELDFPAIPGQNPARSTYALEHGSDPETNRPAAGPNIAEALCVCLSFSSICYDVQISCMSFCQPVSSQEQVVWTKTAWEGKGD